MISYETLRTILTMSITGSIIAVILFALKPIVRDRLPKSTQYYLWLVVIAALVVPISRFVVLPASEIPTISNTVDWYVVSNDDIFKRIRPYEVENDDGFIGIPESGMAEVEALAPDTWVPEAVDWFRLIHYLGAVACLAFIYCSNAAYTGKIKRRNNTATAEEHAMLAELCGGERTPLLYRNPLAATPMMIGIFRPAIILPGREYTNEQLRAVLLHELTHLRRKDVLVKWLSVFVVALHWFNPIVWLVRREIDRACELACDEAVIRNLDTDGKQNYGETLLYVAADSKTPHAVLSTTMCEEKKALKERLSAIMRSKKQTRLAIIVSAVLVVAVGSIAIALGAGRATAKSNYNFDTFIVSGYKLHGYMDDEAISTLTPTEPLNSESGYEYNFEEIRFDLDADSCITRFHLNVYDIGIFNMWVQYSEHHPDKREGNNGLAFLGDGDDILRRIEQVEVLIGEGEKGWYDREQRLRYERYTADNGGGDVMFVYTDGEDDGILNRLVWVIAESDAEYSHITAAIPEKTPLLDVNLTTLSSDGNSQTQISRDVRAAQLTNDWYVANEKGDGFGYSADSFHPLQKQDGYGDVTLNLNNNGTITFLFSDNYPPQSVSVQRWNAEYGGTDSVDVWDKGEPINVTGNTFQINDNGNDYIYEVYAKWNEGSSWYVFRIDSASSDPQSATSDDIYELIQRVENSLSIIMSSPLTSSNPQDYINAHQEEYENLTFKYSDGVLEYLLSEFETGNSGGLRGHIMMRVCKDILGLSNNVTDESLSPQEWYSKLSIISETWLPDFKPENPEGEYGELVYSAITQFYSRLDDGFLVAAPTVYGAYEEESSLKIFMTVFYERYKLYGKTLESTGGGVIPGAAIFTKNENTGEWVLEEYLEVGSANLPDGAYFGDSIRKLCVMPVSGQEIVGLAKKMNEDYVNDTRRELLLQNLIKHLSAQGQAGVSLKKPGGEMVPLT